MLNRIRFFLFFVVLSGLVVTTADAESISASVSRTNLSQAEVFQLQIEVQGDSDTPPDLSSIYQDFEIVGRSQNRQTRTINGNRQQRASLTLTLQPKRAGNLEIPAIRLGKKSTRPILIQVSEAETTQEIFPGTASPQSSPFMQPWGMPQFPGISSMPDYSAFGTPSDIPVAPHFPPSTPSSQPSMTTPPQEAATRDNVWQSTGPEVQPTLASRPQVESKSLWLTWVLAIGWLLTLIFWWRSRNQAPATPHPTVAVQTEATIGQEDEAIIMPPLAPTILAVKEAYEAKDAAAAKTALLRWGEDTFHDHSPANLSRLATHCPGRLSAAILQLDTAFFSPEPSTWWEQPVWQWLTDFTSGKNSK